MTNDLQEIMKRDLVVKQLKEMGIELDDPAVMTTKKEEAPQLADMPIESIGKYWPMRIAALIAIAIILIQFGLLLVNLTFWLFTTMPVLTVCLIVLIVWNHMSRNS